MSDVPVRVGIVAVIWRYDGIRRHAELKILWRNAVGAHIPLPLLNNIKKGVDVNGIKEEWKPLNYKDLDLSDRFLISNTGKIYSLKSKKILKTRVNPLTGYEEVCISLGHRKNYKTIKVHQAVAYNYVSGYSPDLIVNHKDGNKLNNIYTNLEWVTYSENSQHAVSLGLFEPVNRKPIKQIDIKTGKTIGIFESIQDAQQALGGKRRGRNIGHALYDRNKTAYGYKWEFV